MAIHLLIFDDDPDFSALLEDAFAGDEFDVLVTASPHTGLELFKKNHYDLVITDNRMPGMDGVDLIGKLREINAHIPIILMSGFLEPATLAKAHSFRVTEIFSKPLNIIDLIKKAKELCGL